MSTFLKGFVVGLVALAMVVAGLPPAPASAVDPTPPVVNEFSASTTGTDVEFVEVLGDVSSDYSAYTVLEIEGDGTGAGVVDEVIPVGSTDGSGFWLVSLPSNALENGTITLLLVEGFTGALGDDLDTDNDGTLDVTPWSAVVDAVAVSDGGSGDLTYGVPVLGQNYDGVSFTPGGASRIPDGVDTDTAADWVRNDFDLAGIPGFTGSITVGEAYNTPGEPNQAYEEPPPPSEACGDPFTPIYDVQGDGLASPIAGTEVAVEGVVVGDFQEGLDGFYLQDPTGDGNAATSDGVFVFAPGAADVSSGDALRVRGTVSEFFGMTQMSAGTVWTCSTGNPLPGPATVSLPVSSLDDFEPFEGMYVTIPQTLTISEFFNFDRFGEIVLTTDRQFQPTAVYEPGSPEAAALAEANRLSRITLDDGRSSQNPDPAIHPNGEEFTLDNLFRGGDTVANVTGVLDYRFSLYRIQPTEGADYTSENPRPLDPPDVGGSLQVASFNVLNYFTTLGSRGADTPEEFERQEAKIVAALAAMDADVVGLIEIENNEEAIETLVAALNDEMGDGTYDFIDTGVIGGDEIKVAFIYKPATVTPVGDYAVLDSTVDPRFLDDKNRPVLAQTFQDASTGGIFTVAVNHLKSKGSPCDDVGDPDTGDGSGNCNLTREAAAEAMVDWLATDPTGSGDEDFLIIGDLNSYDKEDPIDALLQGADDILGTEDDYTDLVAGYQGEFAYSYVFDGQLGYLDHALANGGMAEEVTGAAVWHINADESDLIDYDTTFKKPPQVELFAPDPFRSSDHDPVIVGLDVCDEIAPTIEVTASPDVLWPANGKYVEVVATVVADDDFDSEVDVTLVSVTSNEPDNGLGDGNTVNDIVIVDDTTFLLRAERSALGTGRIYTITYVATDDCGNQTFGMAEVTVPISQGRR